MISSHHETNLSAPLQKMLNALDLLHQLQKDTHRASNGKLIINTLRELQQGYHALNSNIAEAINAHLRINNLPLYEALQKKGSKICKPLELASQLHDSLAGEIRSLIAMNPALYSAAPAPESTAKSTTEFNVDQLCDSNNLTMVINSDKPADQQLSLAVHLAGRQMETSVYFMFSHDIDADVPASPPLAIIFAMENLLKTKTNKERLYKGNAKSKPEGYDNAYRTTLLKQFKTLQNNRDVLEAFLADHKSHEKSNDTEPTIKVKISNIIDLLDKEKVKTVPDMIVATGKISEIIDEALVSRLKLFKPENSLALSQ